jgi:PTH2 family peptidyl-tRNA hydrolase
MDIKQVIIIRSDLKMSRGKEIEQGSRASNGWLENRLSYPKHPTLVYGQIETYYYQNMEVYIHVDEIWWITNGAKKVTVQVNSEEELVELYEKAKKAKLNFHLVIDEGLTEFNGVHTKTALCLGPNKSEKIDKITSHLKVY